jgi:hypothetical protein
MQVGNVQWSVYIPIAMIVYISQVVKCMHDVQHVPGERDVHEQQLSAAAMHGCNTERRCKLRGASVTYFDTGSRETG